MEKGWSAEGLLGPLWKDVGGRDALARLTGITGQTLSAYNSGKRPLGVTNARRIAAALNVTLTDLGAPVDVDPEGALTMHARLAELGAMVEQLQTMLGAVMTRLEALEARGRGGRRRASGGH